MVQLKYTVAHDGTGWNDFVLNIPSGLFISQRKMHRSCLEYKINGGYVFDSNQDVKVKFGVAPDNFAVRAAIKRTRNAWLKMHRQLLANNPAMKPKWHDFKMMLVDSQFRNSSSSSPAVTTYNVPEDIFDANYPHEEAGITFSVFTTEDSRDTTTLSGQELVDANKDEFCAHLLGPHNYMTSAQDNFWSIGALQSWMDSRPDLDPVSTISDSESDAMQLDPINLLFNDGDADDEIIENFHNAVNGDGDQEGDTYPMYHLQRPIGLPADGNQGADAPGVYNIMEVAAATTTSQSPISYFTGFNALLGQVYVRMYTERPGAVDFMFDVDPRGMTI